MWPSRIWITRWHAAAASGLCVIMMMVDEAVIQLAKHFQDER